MSQNDFGEMYHEVYHILQSSRSETKGMATTHLEDEMVSTDRKAPVFWHRRSD